jgi:hypothetical protein
MWSKRWHFKEWGLGWFMVFNATFNNISVILWWSVLLVEETGVPGKNHRPVASHWQTLSHNVYGAHLVCARFELTSGDTTIQSWPQRLLTSEYCISITLLWSLTYISKINIWYSWHPTVKFVFAKNSSSHCPRFCPTTKIYTSVIKDHIILIRKKLAISQFVIYIWHIKLITVK